MSIGSYTPSYGSYPSTTPSYGASTSYGSTPSYGSSTDSYTSSSSVDYGQGVPVQNSMGGISKVGLLAGAAGGGFLGWKFLVPMLLKNVRSPFSLAAAGIIGACALVGGFLGNKLTGG